jgi:hypothetical protein
MHRATYLHSSSSFSQVIREGLGLLGFDPRLISLSGEVLYQIQHTPQGGQVYPRNVPFFTSLIRLVSRVERGALHRAHPLAQAARKQCGPGSYGVLAPYLPLFTNLVERLSEKGTSNAPIVDLAGLNAWCELHGEDLSGRCPRSRVSLPPDPEGKGADSSWLT